MKLVTSIEGISGRTVRVAVTDTVQTLADAIVKINNKSPISILITCESYDVKFAFGVDPVPVSGTGLGHILYATYSVVLNNTYTIRNFRFINETILSNGILNVTPFYEIGTDLS